MAVKKLVTAMIFLGINAVMDVGPMVLRGGQMDMSLSLSPTNNSRMIAHKAFMTDLDLQKFRRANS